MFFFVRIIFGKHRLAFCRDFVKISFHVLLFRFSFSVIIYRYSFKMKIVSLMAAQMLAFRRSTFSY